MKIYKILVVMFLVTISLASFVVADHGEQEIKSNGGQDLIVDDYDPNLEGDEKLEDEFDPELKNIEDKDLLEEDLLPSLDGEPQQPLVEDNDFPMLGESQTLPNQEDNPSMNEPHENSIVDPAVTINDHELQQMKDDAKMCAIELARKDDLIMALELRTQELIKFIEDNNLQVPEESEDVQNLLNTEEFDQMMVEDAEELIEDVEHESEVPENKNLLKRFFGFFN